MASALFIGKLQGNQLKCCFGLTRPFDHSLLDNMKKLFTQLFAILTLVSVAQAASAADVVGNAKAAENKVAMCIGCHAIAGYKATYPEVFQVPMIGGQSAKYIESALQAYRKGDRKHPTMRGIAGSMSDQDIADLAAYYSMQK